MTADDETGTILATGGPELLTERGRRDRVESLQGAFATPGFWDSHVHLLEYGRSFDRLHFGSEETLASILDQVRERGETTPGGTWIVGTGWNLQALAGRPDRASLDRAAGPHPTLLISLDAHSAWVNRDAITRLGLSVEKIGPSGLLQEGAAFRAQQAVVAQSGDDWDQALERALGALSRLGFVGATGMEYPDGFDRLQRLCTAGQLPLRVQLFLREDNVARALLEAGVTKGFGNHWLWLAGMKFFSDGALGSHTAALRQPYEEEPSNVGIRVLDRETLDSWSTTLTQGGLALAIHAIGDDAVADTVGALAAVASPGGILSRVEHAQLLPDQALDMLSGAPLAVSMQPVHLLVDRDISDRHWGARSRWAFRVRDLLERQVAVTFGSDAPIADPNPVWGLWAAVHRAKPGDSPWHPAQKITPEQAIWCYTRGAAIADGRRSGLIEPGFWGDFTLWSEDPRIGLSRQEPERMRVVGTIVGGRRKS